MAEERFGDFLRESFAALQVERPDIYAEMCRVLGSRRAWIEVDGEGVEVIFRRDQIRLEQRHTSSRRRVRPRGAGVDATRTGPKIEVRTTRDTILGMIDGKWSLMTAIEQELLWLCGETDDLIAFHDGLITYLHGAVRAPSFPGLLRRFRRVGRAREDA